MQEMPIHGCRREADTTNGFENKAAGETCFRHLSWLFIQVLFSFYWVSMARSGLLLESFHVRDHFSRSLEHLRSTNLMVWMCLNLCRHSLWGRDCQYTVHIHSEWLWDGVHIHTICSWFNLLQKSSCRAQFRAWYHLCSSSRPSTPQGNLSGEVHLLLPPTEGAAEGIRHREPLSEVAQQKQKVGRSWLGCTGRDWATTAVSSQQCLEAAS